MTIELNQRAELADIYRSSNKHVRAVSLSLPEDAQSATTTAKARDAADEQTMSTAAKVRSATSADCSSVPLKRGVRGSHRRAQTIIAAGNLELQQLQQLMQMEVLQHDLESKSKELEESQEEAHLAALIGQSLLQRTEEMGAEIESTAMELLSRAENAEHEVQILEAKLSKAYAHIRSMEVAKAKTVDESDEISQEIETLRLRVRALKSQITKAHDETQQTRTAKEYADEALESTKDALTSLQAAHSRLLSESKAQAKRLQELEAAERYNLEHIARLEIENQSICLQSRMLERREQKLQSENESMASTLVAQRQGMRDADAAKREFETAIEAMTDELDNLKEALATEQLRVAHLTTQNKELQDRLDDDSKPEEAHTVLNGFVSSPTLRRGSLFYELSMQLKDEMRQSQQQAHAIAQTHPSEEANQQSGLDAGAAKASASRALVLDIDDDDNNDGDDLSASDGAPVSSSDAEQQQRQRSQDEEDILKEFFMLTAAAVKIAGGGLGNDTCNILNEDLYEEALREGLTFDQYHKWLERRLEDAPEVAATADKKHALPLSPSSGAAGSTSASHNGTSRRGSLLLQSF